MPALVKAELERGLQAELPSHLGYEKGSQDAPKHAIFKATPRKPTPCAARLTN